MSFLSFRFSAAKYWLPPPIMMSNPCIKYCSAMSSWLLRLLLLTQNPAGVACVIGTVVTQPAIFPAFLNFCQMGKYCSPLALTFNEPFGTRTPPPHDELPADESVTIELAEAVSINARDTRLSLYN